MVPISVSTKLGVAFAGLLMAGIAGQAQAATVTFTYDFTGDTTGYTSSKNFTSVEGGVDDPTLKVTGLTYNEATTNTSSVSNGVGQWEGLGLGLKSAYNDDSHTVDSSGPNDLLKLAFSEEVTLISATFTYAGYLLHSVGGFAYFVDDDGGTSRSLNGDNIFLHALMEDYDAGDHTGSYDFLANELDFTSMTFGIGAIWSLLQTTTVCDKWGYPSRRHSGPKVCIKSHTESFTLFDSFKLASVTVSQYVDPNEGGPVVPLPAGFVLLLSGLTGMGFLSRFKNKLSKAVA